MKLGKKLLITEKPSVAMEFSKALKVNGIRKNGYFAELVERQQIGEKI